jgi:hypothetical protein
MVIDTLPVMTLSSAVNRAPIHERHDLLREGSPVTWRDTSAQSCARKNLRDYW